MPATTATAQARAWNLCWKPGAPVTVTGVGRTTTTSEAAADMWGAYVNVHSPMWGEPVPVSLDRVRPVSPEMIDAAALRNAM